MNEWLKQIKDSWNQTSDSDWYQSLRTDEKIAKLIKDAANAFHPAVYSLIKKHIPDLHDKTVLLPSSGDNHAAFAGEEAPYNGEPEYSINTEVAESLGFRFSTLKDWIYDLIDYYIEEIERES